MKRTLFFLSLLIPTLSFAQQWTKIDCGTEYAVALKSDGSLWSWGFNGNGQLGHGNTTAQNTPIQIGMATNWKDFATGAFHCLAIKTDGTLWAWGLNNFGQLGTGTMNDEQAPVQIGTDTDWKLVEAGFVHSFAIKNDNSLWAWGFNTYGQLGIGSTNDTTAPTRVGMATDWEKISTGGAHTLAIKQNGTLWSWGFNATGQLGLGNLTDQSNPTQIGTANNWVEASAGFEFSLARKTDGSLWSWGFNGNSQLGDDGLGAQQLAPVNFETSTGWKMIEAGASYGFAIKNDNTLYTWGYNGNGQLGVGNTLQQDNMIQVNTDTDWFLLAGADGAVVGNTVLGGHTLALKNSKTSMCATGANYQGQLGNGSGVDAVLFACNTGALNIGVTDIFSHGGINIYPNPAHTIINISQEKDNNLDRLKIYTLTGQVVLDIPIYNTSAVDVSGLTPSIYTIDLLKHNTVCYRSKLVVE